jgi:hypothetical protein
VLRYARHSAGKESRATVQAQFPGFLHAFAAIMRICTLAHTRLSNNHAAELPRQISRSSDG